ncbi:hypothetical protein [Streptomyces sp. cmx-18-6]|uniref:hypothetical protein n=1 Tax=Streptomyces sp. cmx-18-6 TaxID=2790930 RepID=UPI00397F9FEC
MPCLWALSEEETDVLQCTAVTEIPISEVLVALAAMDDGPDDPPGSLALDHYSLCELGEHDTRTDHAALLWPAETPSRPALWFFWAGSGPEDRVHRVETVPWCPAVLRNVDTGGVLRCALFDRHTASHSWGVTDPLGDLIAGGTGSGDATDDPRRWPQ